MATCEHENVISYYQSFIDKSEVWLVMPLISAGSCHDVQLKHFEDGINNEAVIATILKHVLLGLQYFHENGQIHRDIKAGNIFIHKTGQVCIGDFGVAAHVKKGEKTKTFVGSPCWMAPEVVEQQSGYDHSADIWSTGITAIELAEGKAPLANMPAMKIIISIMNSSPPTLSDESKWSSNLQQFIDMCLQKEPSKRASTEDLLKTKFISGAKDIDYLRDNFVMEVKSIKDQIDPTLVEMGKEFLEER